MESESSTVDLVVVGQGYVGLPLAQLAARAGLRVVGLDLSPDLIDGLNSGESHIDDVDDEQVAEMIAAGYRATTDEDVYGRAATIVICVPTPLSPEGGPDLGAVTGSARAIASRLRPGTLVILESTTYPGTTEEVVKPILEAGSGLTAGVDFQLAFSPERVDPGNPTFGIANTAKVVGGLTQDCGRAAAEFYGHFIDTVVRARGTREAEMAKLLENTYRHVNIALVNEMAIFCQDLDVDLWDAIACASTKPFGYQAFRPGPGVGGHCIPIDPNYLSYKVKTLGFPFRFVELAQEINARMPDYVLRRAGDLLNDDAGLALRRSNILLLGVTYKADIADQRESPARQVAEKLIHKGANLVYHDPHVDGWTVAGREVARATDLPNALAAADLTILLTDHAVYTTELLTEHTRLLLDTRGTLRDPASDAEGRLTNQNLRKGLTVL